MIAAIVWQASPLAWLALLGTTLAAGAALVAYRRLQHVRFATPMLLFRLVALALLALAAFAPSLDVARSQSRRRQIVFILDDSRSMTEVEPRNEGQALRIAEALGMIDRGKWAGDELLEQARQLPAAMTAVEAARAQRDQVRLAAQPPEQEQKKFEAELAALRERVAALQSAARANDALGFAVEPLAKIAAAVDQGTGPLPAGAVEDLVRDLQRHQRFADRQRARTQTVAAAAAKSVAAMSRYKLAREVATQLSATLSAEATPVFATADGTLIGRPAANADRTSSPLTAGLAAAVEHVGATDCEGVILLSDGRSTEPRPALSPSLLAAGVPIYAVDLSGAQPPPDVRIAKLVAPPSVLTGENIPLRVTLQQRGAAGTLVHVSVTDGKTTLKRDVTLTDSPAEADFTWRTAAAPSVHLTATVEPLTNEARQENNTADTTLAVVDRKVHVTLISGSAGWDLQYLRNALSRSPWVQLQQQILAGGESCRFSVKELAEQDVIVLCDLPARALSAEQRDAIAAAVSQKGKSVLLLPGDGNWLRAAAAEPKLASLVPQRLDEQPAWRLPPSETPTVQPVPTPPAESLPLLRLDESADASMQRWLARPRLFRYLDIGQLKPQARVLLVDRSTGQPLMIEQAVGSGRAMALLVDETWRWRRETGAEAGDRFWLDLVRDLVDPPMAKTHGDLALGVERDPVAAGQPLNVRARVAAGAAGKAKLSLVQKGKTISTLSPNELLSGSGRLNATFTPTTPGPAELVLSDGSGDVRLPVTIADPASQELADTSPDPALLARIAQQTGGVVVPVDEFDTLPSQIALRRSERVDTIHLDLWSSPYWFAAIVACLGVEWALRKLAGMI